MAEVTQQDYSFLSRAYQYAATAARQLGVPQAGIGQATIGILTQWAEESGFGTNYGALHYNNFAGIKAYNNYQTCNGGGTPAPDSPTNHYCTYPDFAGFAQAYVDVLNQSDMSPAKSGLLSGPLAFFKGLKATPYDSQHYAGNVLESEYNIVKQGVHGLQAFGVPLSGVGKPLAPVSNPLASPLASLIAGIDAEIGAVEQYASGILELIMGNILFVGIAAFGVYLLFRNTPVSKVAGQAAQSASAFVPPVPSVFTASSPKQAVKTVAKSVPKVAEVAAVA